MPSRSTRALWAIWVAGYCLAASPAEAQFDFSDGNDYQEMEQVDYAANAARDQEAEANFDAIMIPQNKLQMPMANEQQSFRRPAPRPVQASPQPATIALPPAAGSEVEVPLGRYLDVRKRLLEIYEEAGRRLGPAVVLGSSEYSGEAIQGALRLTLALQVTLGRPEKWKTVPLVGDDVVLVKATVNNKPVPVSRRSGYQVWATRQTGEVTVIVELLVPARGPRGSIEYDFLVPRTPVTKFSCQFPVAGLEPRLDAAVQSEARPNEGGTLLTATLRPTARIHLVGFRDLGTADSQQAKVYAESLNLLSIDEGSLDVFTVIRYTILYAGTKEFRVRVPEGLEVVTADGMGAFRFELSQDENGTILQGETAFPIRNNYEISLRLHRETPKEGETFEVPLPRCLATEREIGFLGVEVPGKLKLEEGRGKQNITSIDVRQLPEEMVRSAVSPILRAYRYHSSGAQLSLVTAQLPDREPASGSIDRIRAFSTVTQEGHVMTDMRITLRNRLRHSLTLSVPEGTEVRSALLDGQPVKPSRNDQARLMLPLKRSSGGDRLRPFTLSLVVHTEISPLGWFGSRNLKLPASDLPVSSLQWSVYLPARNMYTRLRGDIEPQTDAGRAGWHRPSHSYQQGQWTGGQQEPTGEMPTVGPVASAHSGAMPVRIKLPSDGTRMDYYRYWIDKGVDEKDPTKDRPIEISFCFVWSLFRIPAWMALAVLMAIGMWMISTRFTKRSNTVLVWTGCALAIAVLWPLFKLGGLVAIFIGFLLGWLLIALRRSWLRKIPAGLSEWARTLRERFRKRQPDPKAWTPSWVLARMVVTIGILCCGVLLLEFGFRFLLVLLNPL